jgi:hypothetical protein
MNKIFVFNLYFFFAKFQKMHLRLFKTGRIDVCIQNNAFTTNDFRTNVFLRNIYSEKSVRYFFRAKTLLSSWP